MDSLGRPRSYESVAPAGPTVRGALAKELQRELVPGRIAAAGRDRPPRLRRRVPHPPADVDPRRPGHARRRPHRRRTPRAIPGAAGPAHALAEWTADSRLHRWRRHPWRSAALLRPAAR